MRSAFVVYEAEIASESEVKEGASLTVTYEGRPVVIIKKDGIIYAYLDICTHVGGNLLYEKNTLYCEWHGSRFDLKTGRAIKGPAPIGSQLIPLPIDVKEGKVYYVYPPRKPSGSWHIFP